MASWAAGRMGTRTASLTAEPGRQWRVGGGRWEVETVDKKLVPPRSTALSRQKAPKGDTPFPSFCPSPSLVPSGSLRFSAAPQALLPDPSLHSWGPVHTHTPGVSVPGHWCWDRGHLTAMTQQRESSPSAHVPVNALRPSPPHPGNLKGQDCHLHRVSGRTPSPESSSARTTAGTQRSPR